MNKFTEFNVDLHYVQDVLAILINGICNFFS